MKFVLLDEATDVGNAPEHGGAIAPTTLARIASALNVQLNRDVATWWGGAYWVRAGTSRDDIQPGEVACVLLDALPNDPSAVAYHDVNGAEVPVVFLARVQCTSVLSGPASVACALSHELCETAGDPYVNAWRDDGHGSEWAQELCDAVQEAGAYTIDGVALSNFVLPEFFAPGAPPPYDYAGTLGVGTLAAPFALAPGGYQLKRTSGGGETQVFGKMSEHRMARARLPSSRTYRRGARV